MVQLLPRVLKLSVTKVHSHEGKFTYNIIHSMAVLMKSENGSCWIFAAILDSRGADSS